MPITKEAVKEQPKEVKAEVERILVSSPPEVDRALYDMLDIYGKDCSDPDTQEKVKFISETLGEHPKDNLMQIITEIGITPQGETKLGRIYKYLRLRQQSDKALKHYQTIKGQMNFMRSNPWA
jgi:hypothetical protein